MLPALRAIASVVLLLLVAACASKPVAKDAPPPAPSYLSVLDGGKVVPLDQPLIVTVKPFPTATYKKTKQVWLTVGGRELTASLKLAGRVSAQQNGDLITIVDFVDQAGASGNLPMFVELAKTCRGAQYKFVVDAYGVVKDYGVSYASPSPKDAKGYEVHNPDLSVWDLPKDGFRQDQVLKRTDPYKTSQPHSAYRGELIVRGQGSYRGRPVIVLEESGNVVLSSNLHELRGYRLLDVETGMWIHLDLVMTSDLGQTARSSNFRYDTIDDLQL